MRILLRLIKWTVDDLVECSIKTAQMYGAEENPDIAEKINEANDKILEAKKAVTEAQLILSQIYQECYDD